MSEGDSIERFVESGKYNYLPIYSYTLGHIATKSYEEDEIRTLEGKRYTWWEDESLMHKYPYFFINPVITAEYSNKTGGSQRDIFRHRKGEQFVVADSGGFQVMSRDGTEIVDSPEEVSWVDAKIHPESLAEWQYENSDAAMTLDIPPYSLGDGWRPDRSYTEWRDEIYYPRLEESVDYTRRMVDRWEEIGVDNFRPVGVIHGQIGEGRDDKWELIDEWFESMKEIKEFDSWAIAPQYVSSIPLNAFFMGYAVDRLSDYSYLHVLKVGNPSIKLILMYASMLSDLWITSDSGSWASATLWRQVYLPQSWSRSVTISNRSDEDREDAASDATRFDMLPCNCEVCSHVKKHKGVGWITEQESDSYNNAALCIHNLKMILQVDNVLEALLRAHSDTLLDDVAFRTERKEDVKRYGNDFWHMLSRDMSDAKIGELHSAFTFIKLCHDYGIEEAFREMDISYTQNQSWRIGRASSAFDF